MDRDSLVYGQSITDACMGWDMTVPVLRELAASRALPPRGMGGGGVGEGMGADGRGLKSTATPVPSLRDSGSAILVRPVGTLRR